MKKVSIIIPIYNVDKYLNQCLKSVTNQSHINLEIILVNDGSSDDSGKIADKYAKEDRRIIVIHQVNSGVSAARNAGIKKATGEYICFVDGDDYVMPDYVSYMLNLALDHGADVSLTTEMFSLMHPSQLQDKIKVYSPEIATTEILYSNIPIGCYCKLFRRDFIGKNKLLFLPEYLMGEGFNFNTSAFQLANKIIAGRRKIYHYRLDNIDSVTTKFNIKKWLNGLDALKNIKRNFIIKTDSTDAAWQFAWWLTNYDILRLMIGASEQKIHRKEYLECLKVVKNMAPRLSNLHGSIGRKIRIVMIKTSPIFATLVDNYRRSNAMKKINKLNGAIVCITTNNNYGNVIQRFAMQKFLQKNGYNFISYYFYGYYIRQYLIRQSRIFAPLRLVLFTVLGKRRYLRKSSSIYNYYRMSKFCNKRIKQELFIPFFVKRYKTYIVGSDQVFNYGVISKEFLVSWKNFFLSFIKWEAKKIAYAPSFGNEKLTNRDIPITLAANKKRIQKFDAVSAREHSGRYIMKKIWDIEAKETLDPTLLLSTGDYQDLIDHSLYKLSEVKPVFYYILRDDAYNILLNLSKSISKKLNKDIDGIMGHSNQTMPAIEQWLKGFSDAEFITTDSFHGAVFSIINHKEFIVMCLTKFKNGGGSVRYRNLLEKLGLTDRIIDEKDFNNLDVTRLTPINWSSVDERLEKLQKDSKDWLLTQLKDNNEQIY